MKKKKKKMFKAIICDDKTRHLFKKTAEKLDKEIMKLFNKKDVS